MEMEPEDTLRRKRARVSGGVVSGSCSAGGPDRLSSLPDCLLHSIMSFLKARQAVQTCVLSTRWRHLWRSVPCLDIDFDEFKKVPVSDNNSGWGGDDNSGSGGEDNSDSDGDGNSDSSDHDSSSSDSDPSDSDSDRWLVDPDNNHKDWKHFTKYKEWEDFEDFAVTLMRRCNVAQLDSFRLDIVPSRAPKFGNRVAAGWLRRAMKYYSLGGANQHGLSSRFWRLKRLHLCHVLLEKDFLNCVSSVCCSLEDLELDGCTCHIYSVTSHSLKTLVLKNCGWRNLSGIISPTLKTLVIDGVSNAGDCLLIIMTPALACLHLAVDIYKFCGGVLIHNASSVVQASIHLKGHLISSGGTELAGDQFKLLCSISSSVNLKLSGVGTQEPRFQEFKNLRNLLLEYCDLSDDFKTLVFFLRHSAILEKLTLRHCAFPEYSNKKKGTPILNKTSSSELSGLDLLCENLKVEIIYKHDRGNHLINLLLRISENLSKTNIKLTKVH